MNNCDQYFKWIVLAFALILSACEVEQSTHIDTATNLTSQNAIERNTACGIAMSSFHHTSSIDPQLIQYQANVRKFSETNPALAVDFLERLGWAYVSAAQKNHDPGFYTFAQQTALCMQSILPDSASARLLTGHVLQQRHQFAQAEAIAQGLVKERGLWFDYGLLGDALIEQGKIQKAAMAYQKMIDQKPGSQSYSRAAHLRWLRGDLQGAIELMEMSVRATSPRDETTLLWSLSELAQFEFASGDLNRALTLVNHALSLSQNHPASLYIRGLILLERKDYNGAIESLLRANKENALPEYQWALIDSLRLNNRNKEADELNKSLVATGEIEDARTLSLYLATQRQSVDTALSLARQELASRKDAFTYDALAWATWHARDEDQDPSKLEASKQRAYQYIQKALSSGIQHPRLFLHAGLIAAGNHDHIKARLWLAQARQGQHMLLPSERVFLPPNNEEFAKPYSQKQAPTSS